MKEQETQGLERIAIDRSDTRTVIIDPKLQKSLGIIDKFSKTGTRAFTEEEVTEIRRKKHPEEIKSYREMTIDWMNNHLKTLEKRKLNVITKLGDGAMGVVYLVEDYTNPNNIEEYALKVLRPDVLNQMDGKDREETLFLWKREEEISKRPFLDDNSPALKRIVKINDSFYHHGLHMHLMKYIEGLPTATQEPCRDLNDFIYLNSPDKNTSEKMKNEYFKDITRFVLGGAKAVAFLHRNDLVHMDIKPENFLLKLTKDGIKRSRLTDFGISLPISPDGEFEDKLGGTPGFAAPEVFNYGEFSKASDIFSLGVVLFYATTKGHVYEDTTLELGEYYFNYDALKNTPSPINIVTNQTVREKPSQRPNIEKLKYSLVGLALEQGIPIEELLKEFTSLPQDNVRDITGKSWHESRDFYELRRYGMDEIHKNNFRYHFKRAWTFLKEEWKDYRSK